MIVFTTGKFAKEIQVYSILIFIHEALLRIQHSHTIMIFLPVTFFTERYRDHPLVIRGPGAGAEVTAAGVFSDIIQVVRSCTH